MREALLDDKQKLRYVAVLWKPDLEHGIDITDGHDTAIGRLVLAGQHGVDLSQKDGAMRDTLSKTRSNRGKLSLKRCRQALIELLVESGCSEDQESTDWTLDNTPATWHTQLVGGIPGGDWCFAALTAQDYPNRYMREFLGKLATSFRTNSELQIKIKKWLPRPKNEGLNIALRPVLSSLSREYTDLSEKSKVHAVLAEVKKVKEVMEENISLAIGNIESAEQLEATTEELEAGSAIFKEGATTLRKRECTKGIKLNIAIAGACLLLMCVAGFTIFETSNSEP